MLRYRFLMLMVTFGTIAGTVMLYINVPKGLFPNEDTGFIQTQIEAATDTSFEAMVERQRRSTRSSAPIRPWTIVNSSVGAGGPNPTGNTANMFIALKPKGEREPIRVVMQRLRRQDRSRARRARRPSAAVQNINIGGRMSSGEYQYALHQRRYRRALCGGADHARQDRRRFPACARSRTDLWRSAIRN